MFKRSGGTGADVPMAGGRYTTVTAVDIVDTGMRVPVEGVLVSLESDPVDGAMGVSAVPGPAAGQITIKTWSNTGGTDPTPAAASVFSKVVNWFAWGKS